MSDSKIAKQPEKKNSGKGVTRVVAAFKNLGKRFTSFIISMKQEIKRIMWPDRKRLVQSTATVLVIVIITAVILFTVDTLLGKTLEAVGFYTPASTTVETTTASTTAAVAETTAAQATTAASETTAATTTAAKN